MLKLLGLVLVVYVLVCVFVYAQQRSLIYYPTPASEGGVGEAVAFPVSGAVLQLRVVRRAGSSAVIYFGGNAESVTASADELARAAPDRTWVFVNYRGYGGSTGSPSERALVADALAVWDWARAKYTDVAVVGRSLGSGVAVQLAASRPVSHLVLVTPFDSLVSVGQAAMPWLPVSWLAKDRYESVDYAPRISCPSLVLIAANDEVVAPAHARRLVAAFRPGTVSFLAVSGAGHNDIQLWPPYGATIGGVLMPNTPAKD
jgi:pimeloyl-ACP methyl ester carboxylesterase